MDSFKDHPDTIGELRSDKSENAADWTPRDACISMLRDIDNGLEVATLIICYSTPSRLLAGQGVRDVCYKLASPDTSTTLGTLARVQNLILNPK